MLVPSKKGVAKCVRYLISLSVVISIVLPLGPIISSLTSLSDDYETERIMESELQRHFDNTNELILEQNKEIICEAIKSELREKFSIPSHECEVLIETETTDSNVTVSRVNIVLSGYSMWKDASEIRALVHSLVGAECEVIAG